MNRDGCGPGFLGWAPLIQSTMDPRAPLRGGDRSNSRFKKNRFRRNSIRSIIEIERVVLAEIESTAQTCHRLVVGSHASALLSRGIRWLLAALVAVLLSPLPDLRTFPRALSREHTGQDCSARKPIRELQSQWSRSSGGAPKRHEVGRVARRVRPDIACRCNTLFPPTPPYPNGGA